ncbi:MAG: CPBP family intramembrane metalloprotease [Planctomycetes bacterium]|nr:CPBP family intramembrane metalloprotease [Planctomycetota bacterium]
MDEPMTASATATIAAALALSLVAIVVASFRQVGGKLLLPYEPRQRVPWGIVAIIVPLYCVLNPFIQAFTANATAEVEVVPADFIFDRLAEAVVLVGFVFAAMPWLAVVCGATLRDLGLPSSSQQLGRDIGIGVFACIASLLPIYAVQFVLTVVLQPEQEHPLIKQLIEHQSTSMLLVSAVVAVIAAPLFEEFTFRLLLQGWLERREDELLGIQETERQPALPVERQDEAATQLATSSDPEDSFPLPGFTAEAADAPAVQGPGMLPGLPHGWSPVLISGLAFGLAHFGHGVAPIPLFLFGIVLGYLYQRTHRLAPCITAHALFNAYTMIVLWMQIG